MEKMGRMHTVGMINVMGWVGWMGCNGIGQMDGWVRLQ